MKKGRHRRYEEARKFKRSYEDDLQGLVDSLNKPEDEYIKPEHAAWAVEFDSDHFANGREDNGKS